MSLPMPPRGQAPVRWVARVSCSRFSQVGPAACQPPCRPSLPGAAQSPALICGASAGTTCRTLSQPSSNSPTKVINMVFCWPTTPLT